MRVLRSPTCVTLAVFMHTAWPARRGVNYHDLIFSSCWGIIQPGLSGAFTRSDMPITGRGLEYERCEYGESGLVEKLCFASFSRIAWEQIY